MTAMSSSSSITQPHSCESCRKVVLDPTQRSFIPVGDTVEAIAEAAARGCTFHSWVLEFCRKWERRFGSAYDPQAQGPPQFGVCLRPVQAGLPLEAVECVVKNPARNYLDSEQLEICALPGWLVARSLL